MHIYILIYIFIFVNVWHTYLESTLLEVIEDADVFRGDKNDVYMIKHSYIHIYTYTYIHLNIDTYLESILLEVIEDADVLCGDDDDSLSKVTFPLGETANGSVRLSSYIYNYII
jgi:hypothetical protein